MKELQHRGLPCKGVSRSGRNDSLSADLLVASDADAVIKGATYVYLCVGLFYRKAVWDRDWEVLMKNIIDACEAHGARLIFLDNVYLYGPTPLPVPFDEHTSQQPESVKGKARKRTADLMLKALEAGRIRGVIGRSADFIGAGAVNSTLVISFLDRMLKGKAPQWLGKAHVKHTYSNIDDNGRALVELALNEDCYGEVWHLPVGEAASIAELMPLFNKHLGSDFRVQVMPFLLRKLLSNFIPPLKEVEEMLYQFEQEYVMSWTKFRERFPDFRVHSNEESIKEMIDWFQKNSGEKRNF